MVTVVTTIKSLQGSTCRVSWWVKGIEFLAWILWHLNVFSTVIGEMSGNKNAGWVGKSFAFLFSAMFQTVTFYYTHARWAPTTCIEHCVNPGNPVGNKKAVSSDLWGFHSSRGKSMCPDTEGVCFSCQEAWREPSLFKRSNPSGVCQFPLYV